MHHPLNFLFLPQACRFALFLQSICFKKNLYLRKIETKTSDMFKVHQNVWIVWITAYFSYLNAHARMQKVSSLWLFFCFCFQSSTHFTEGREPLLLEGVYLRKPSIQLNAGHHRPVSMVSECRFSSPTSNAAWVALWFFQGGLDQSDQRICYSLIRKVHLNFALFFYFIASLCSWKDRFGLRFVGNPEDRCPIMSSASFM